MNKVNNECLARELAIENSECYGMSVFGGDWYTGTREQLERIGVAEIHDACARPEPCPGCGGNGRMIAAAPEMLALLERMLVFCEAVESRTGRRMEEGNLARALLAKIKGAQ